MVESSKAIAQRAAKQGSSVNMERVHALFFIRFKDPSGEDHAWSNYARFCRACVTQPGNLVTTAVSASCLTSIIIGCCPRSMIDILLSPSFPPQEVVSWIVSNIAPSSSNPTEISAKQSPALGQPVRFTCLRGPDLEYKV